VSLFKLKNRNRWLILMLIFGIGPLVIYLLFISPSIQEISRFQNRLHLQATGSAPIGIGLVPASKQETEQLEEIRQSQLARIKKVNSREDLLRFSGALADALAMEARSLGLQVTGVNLQNASINGNYIPASSSAMDNLEQLPSAEWEELADPLDLPMLRLPSIDMQMTVVSEYSKVFSFIKSLSDFPALVQLTSLQTTDDPNGKAYQLNIRGYYCSSENMKALASVENAVNR
jgi:hypothetical protein